MRRKVIQKYDQTNGIVLFRRWENEYETKNLAAMIVVAFVNQCTLVAEAKEYINSPLAACTHNYSAHRDTGAGYTQDLGTHIHTILVIDDTEIVYSCHKTKVVSYCQHECIYCHVVMTNSHEHAYIRHSYDGSVETLR